MRLIDADKLPYNNIKTNEHGYVETTKTVVLEEDIANARIVQAILIPDNATNGDITKVMFPDYQTKISSGQVCLYYPVREEYSGSWIRFDLEWWNAPYKRESEKQI